MPTIAPIDIHSHCLLTGFLEEKPFFLSADGVLHHLGEGEKQVEIGNGIASAKIAENGRFVVTGGEDGRLCKINADFSVVELEKLGSKWLTAVAIGPDDAYAYATGRVAYSKAQGKAQEMTNERSIEDLAFAPKGLRLALAHYNGVTLHWLGTEGKPLFLEWKGAHTMATFSPDGRFLVTAMQENALHGWRLSDNQHLRMSGYPAKVKSWSWSNKGRYLATSGATAAIVWPFLGKDGPMGKAPLELGTRANALVTCVACHPSEDMVAVGYEDGMVLFVRFADQKEALLRRPGQGAISSMAWDKKGERLAFGSQAGDCGIINITG